MDKNDAHSRLMDYLYDEMDTDERKQFEELLLNSPELQRELDEMQSTRKILQEDSDDIIPKNLILTGLENNDTSGDTPAEPVSSARFFALKTFTAIAAAILLTVSAFSFANLQITHSDSGTLISFGEAPQPQAIDEPEPTEAYITETEFYEMLNELQEQNSQVMATALQQTREQHQQQMEDVIQTLTTYYNQRRQQDLVLVSEGLAQLEQETYYKFLETEQTIEDLIFALNVQQSND